jgi:heme exporter protein D
MIDLGPHAVFIISAYAGVALAVAGLIAYVIADRRKVESRIRALEAQGVRRRSAEVK